MEVKRRNQIHLAVVDKLDMLDMDYWEVYLADTGIHLRLQYSKFKQIRQATYFPQLHRMDGIQQSYLRQNSHSFLLWMRLIPIGERHGVMI